MEKLLRTASTILGMSALVSGVSLTSSEASSLLDSRRVLATARWCFTRGELVLALCRFVVVLVVRDISSWVRLLALVSALLIDLVVIGRASDVVG